MPSTLPQLIQAARRYAQLSQQGLADKVGVSRPAVSHWENDNPGKGTAPTRENIVAISKATGAPLDWLLSDESDVSDTAWLAPQAWEEGDGMSAQIVRNRERLRVIQEDAWGQLMQQPFHALAESVPESEVQTFVEDDSGRYDLDKDAIALQRFALAVQRDFVFVPLLDMRVSAGGGRSDATSEVLNWYAFRRTWLTDDMRMDPEKSGLVVARGDSGEPEIRDRDLLLVDFRVTAVREPGTYVLSIDGEYVVKQAQRNWDGSVAISSANPAYAPSVVPANRIDELTVVGLVRSQQRRR